MQNLTLVGFGLAMIWVTSGSVMAQNGGNQGGNQNGGNGGNNGQPPGGILIQPGGLVDRAVTNEGGGATLQRQLKQAAVRNLSTELNQSSPQRKVSLRELDAEIAKQLQDGATLSPAVRGLAGLTRIDFILIADNGQDVILSGPAEGFAPMSGGRVVGVESGRPVLCLDDLLVAFRSAAAEDSVGCSIDPDPARLAAAQQWLRQNSSPATVDIAKARLARMVELQGTWNISSFGVPDDCRMCLAIIEADYIMKRLTIGIENSGVRGFKSSLAMSGPGDNMMRRWWFAPHYPGMERNAEGTVFRLAGPRFQLFAQEEIMDANGQLTAAGFTQVSSEKFARQFNDKIDELVRRIPAFADLQNIFDILTDVAVIQKKQAEGTLKWKPTYLMDSDALPANSFPAASETTPLLNVKMAGNSLVIGNFTGGVTFKPREMPDKFSESADAHLGEQLKAATQRAGLASRWWWD